MLFGGVTQEWIVGTPSVGVVALLDGFIEGSEEVDTGGFVESIHVCVMAESISVGEFDPATERPSVL
jgi:hypothetical protein